MTNSKPGLNGVGISNAVAGAGFTTITTSSPHGFTSGQYVTIINIKSSATNGVDDLNGNNYEIAVTTPTAFTIPFATVDTYASGGLALNSEVSITGQDGIRYYGILTNGTGWANYNPPVDPNNALAGALLIFAYRGYLVFLNTEEGNDAGTYSYPNRARWTQIGTPYYSEPVPSFPNPQFPDQNAARDDLFGRGGANDAPTNEAIVAAAFIRDILVVYFERSTWRLRFVNNAQNPFVWERVNVDFGSDCTFSAIPFDKGLMTIGNRGIIISDGNDTSRFDEKIPNQVFNIRQSNEGLQRVYGIRTFKTKLVYWAFPSAEDESTSDIYPDQVLVFNYDTKNWSFFDDSYTCFGYYYSDESTGFTWADLTEPWSNYDDLQWNSGVSQQGFESVVAGNQQGYVFELEQTSASNDVSLSISAISNFGSANPAILTSNNNNLAVNSWITLTGVTGSTSDDGVSLNGRNFKVTNATLDPNNFGLSEFKSIDAGAAVGTSYSYTISYQNLIPGSIQINIGTLVFSDPGVNGVLIGAGGSGTINYLTGSINLSFSPAIASTEVYIRIVSLDPLQGIVPVYTEGAYSGGGEVIRISNINIQTKFFNFFNDDQRSRLSKIDFYVNSTANGQFTCNVFADSTNIAANTPLSDNPQSNVVVTSTNPYQIGVGTETIFRLYADVLAQTVQLQLTLSDAQMATNCINSSDIELLAMMFSLRRGGRLV